MYEIHVQSLDENKFDMTQLRWHPPSYRYYCYCTLEKSTTGGYQRWCMVCVWAVSHVGLSTFPSERSYFCRRGTARTEGSECHYAKEMVSSVILGSLDGRLSSWTFWISREIVSARLSEERQMEHSRLNSLMDDRWLLRRYVYFIIKLILPACCDHSVSSVSSLYVDGKKFWRRFD